MFEQSTPPSERIRRRQFLQAVGAMALAALSGCTAARPTATAVPTPTKERKLMDANEILSTAESRIQEHRTAEAQLQFVDRAGKPLPRLRCQMQLVRHEFRLGANAFRIGNIPEAALQSAYEERFAALLNYATLPFYWGSYEQRKGETAEKRLEMMADWCQGKGIIAKGHPLVWHEVYPKWAEGLPDGEVLERMERRVKEIVGHFRGRIDIWDVVNEATVSHRFQNAVGRWIAREGAANCVAQALRWAQEANPDATLLYNDFNISPDFEKLVAGLLEKSAPLRTIGIQSHMHKELWPIEKIWRVCETYGRFGLPLHFTEATVLSGRFKAQDDNDWHRVRSDWPTTPEGEARQAEYGAKFYTVLFSHPAVEAITWWDFSDNGSWQGAPAGLVCQDMSPKPLYEWLMDAFGKRWSSQAEVTTDASGKATLRCFFGEYEVQAQMTSGAELRGRFALARRGERRVRVVMG